MHFKSSHHLVGDRPLLLNKSSFSLYSIICLVHLSSAILAICLAQYHFIIICVISSNTVQRRFLYRILYHSNFFIVCFVSVIISNPLVRIDRTHWLQTLFFGQIYQIAFVTHTNRMSQVFKLSGFSIYRFMHTNTSTKTRFVTMWY